MVVFGWFRFLPDLSCRSRSGIAESHSDRGNVDGFAENLVTVVSGGHRAVTLELVDGARRCCFWWISCSNFGDRFAVAVPRRSQSVRGWCGRDPASPQLGGDRPAGIGVVAQHPAGSDLGRRGPDDRSLTGTRSNLSARDNKTVGTTSSADARRFPGDRRSTDRGEGWSASMTLRPASLCAQRCHRGTP